MQANWLSASGGQVTAAYLQVRRNSLPTSSASVPFFLAPALFLAPFFLWALSAEALKENTSIITDRGRRWAYWIPCLTASRRQGTSDLRFSVGLSAEALIENPSIITDRGRRWAVLDSLPDCVTQAGNQ